MRLEVIKMDSGYNGFSFDKLTWHLADVSRIEGSAADKTLCGRPIKPYHSKTLDSWDRYQPMWAMSGIHRCQRCDAKAAKVAVSKG